MKNMYIKIRWITGLILLTITTMSPKNAQAGSVDILVHNSKLTFDAANSISKAANFVISADAKIKIVNDQLSIIPSGQIGDVIKLGAQAKYIFIAPLVDGRYFVQALTEGDYKKATWLGLKIYTYFYNPLCYQGLTGAENLLTIFNIYQRTIEYSAKYNERAKRLAKEGACAIL
jgi:hypothetical protein